MTSERTVANLLRWRGPGRDAYAVMHDVALEEWVDGVGRASERVALDLCQAIHTWVTFNEDEANSGYGWSHITEPLLNVLDNVLNTDLGRLDPGTISSWSCALAERFGRQR